MANPFINSTVNTTVSTNKLPYLTEYAWDFENDRFLKMQKVSIL